MKWKTIATAIAIGLVLAFSGLNSAWADSLDETDQIAWASIRNYSSEAFRDYFNQKKADGYRITDIEVAEINGTPKYSAIWEFNSDRRNWASLRDLTHDEFAEKWKDFKDQGYRLIDQEAYTVNGQQRYAGVWEENKEHLDWLSYRNVDRDEFGDRFKTHRDQGYRMIDIEAYPSGNQTLYSAIWVKNSPGIDWAEFRDLAGSDYAAKFDALSDQGYRVLDFESYRRDGEQRYAAIFVKNTGGKSWRARRDLDDSGFSNWWNTYTDQGFRLVDFAVYPTSSGIRYAGVWQENSPRFDWSAREAVDKAIAAYQDANHLPGISVVIADDNKIMYRRGFGYADQEAKKAAHAGTVYRLASDSKPNTALVAMRLVDRQKLSLDQPTRNYVANLPAHHTHTVRHLLNHQSGICHYEGCGTPDDRQYTTAAAAAQTFSNKPLLFAPGEKTSYSTHAYTVLAAALEGASGEAFPKLFDREITRGLNLPTLRPENRSQPNPDRAQIYSEANGQNVPAAADNLSWKYAGGGLEASAIDLTKLGMKLLNGSVMSKQARDEMWTRSKRNDGSRSDFGLGWGVGEHQGHKIVAHSGAQTGAGSYWRLYPDDSIVIAILSNRRGHEPRSLANTLGEIVLKAQ